MGRLAVLLEAVKVWIGKSFGTVAITELILGCAVASVSAVFVAWTLFQVIGILLGASILANGRIRIASAVGIADSERVLLVSLAAGSFVAPDGFALDFDRWWGRLTPVAAWASVRAAGVAWARVDANSFLVLTFGKAFAVAIAF